MSQPTETQYKYAITLWRRGLNTMEITAKLSRGRQFESVVYRWVNWHLDAKRAEKLSHG